MFNANIFCRLSAALIAAACLSVNLHAQKKYNVVYVFADQLRLQSVGYMNMDAVQTPHIDALQKRSHDFRNTVSVTPVCTPYRAAFISGQFPLTTGMVLNDVHLPDAVPSVGRVFKEGGYKTAYIGKWHLDGRGRTSYIPKEDRRGFDYWKVLECTHAYLKSAYYDNDDENLKYWPGYDAFAQTDDAIEYMKNNKDAPFFLVISYGIPHFPHGTALEEYKSLYPPDSLAFAPNVPEEFRNAKTREEMQGYFAHTTALDKCVGDLWAALEREGMLENTIFVFSSDHGEMMGSHGKRHWFKQYFWAESSRVPLLIYHPDAKGELRRRPVTTPDITKTLISLAGLRAPAEMEGADFSKVVTSEEKDSDGAALFMNAVPFGYAHSGPPYRAIKTQRHTYVEQLGGETLLFDDIDDVYQTENLARDPSRAALVGELSEKLHAILKERGDTFENAEYYNKKFGYEKFLLPDNTYPEGRDKAAKARK